MSLWILGKFHPPPLDDGRSLRQGPEPALGHEVTSDYFGVPPERLVAKDGVIFFQRRRQYRSKIGTRQASNGRAGRSTPTPAS